MERNFKVRLIVGIGMFVVALIGLYTFDSIPFKIIYGLFALMAGIELLSFFEKKFSISLAVLALVELAFLVCSSVFVARIGVIYVWYIILGVCGYDIFAYLFGKAFGGKVFGASRPFPTISKSKTWEGTIMGLVVSIALVVIMMAVRDAFLTDWMYILCGPLALMGDLFESLLKRRFGVKDSSEVVVKNKIFAGLEHLVGGSAGHGGFLDRIDSTAFTGTVLLIISLIIGG